MRLFGTKKSEVVDGDYVDVAMRNVKLKEMNVFLLEVRWMDDDDDCWNCLKWWWW